MCPLRCGATKAALCAIASLLALPVTPTLAAGRARVAVLAPLIALGIGADETRAVERRLRRATAALKGLRWLEQPRLLRRLRATPPECFEDAACAAALARRLGVDVLVSGEVGGTGAAYVVYLRAHGARGAEMRRARALLGPDSGAEALRASASDEEALLVHLLLPQRYVGTLALSVDAPAAWIYLDGRRVARGAQATLEGIPVGTHTLRVAHQAFHDDVRFVQISYAQRQTLRVKLQPLSLALGANPSGVEQAEGGLGAGVRWPWYRRWWAVTAFGVLVAATATTTVLLLPHAVARDREATLGLP
ncbi:MAG: hypothetical protein IPL40_06410 [Proteobacteria bacterium]|nr:hypothetical protein [Pseudomonadota bacterium]